MIGRSRSRLTETHVIVFWGFLLGFLREGGTLGLFGCGLWLLILNLSGERKLIAVYEVINYIRHCHQLCPKEEINQIDFVIELSL